MSQKNSNGRKETFTIAAPGALSVLLAGDFTHWQESPIPMRQVRGGQWKATVELEPGTHYYRFIVDGHWHDDPECQLYVTNPFGSEDAVRKVA